MTRSRPNRLRWLADHRLFLLSALLGAFCAAGVARADDARSDRRRRIESMTPAEKQELQRRREQFERLPPEEQQRLRNLHHQIEADADADQLREVMHRYSQWARTLPPHRRAELQELPPAERVERIKAWYQEELRQQAGRLGPEDTEGLLRWMEKSAARHEAKFLESLPQERRAQFAALDAQVRQRAVMWMVWQRWLMVAPGQPPAIPEGELAQLRNELSPETRARLEAEPDAEQWKTVMGWIRHELRSQWSRRGRMPMPSADDTQLAQFFESELTSEERDRLLNLPGDEMLRELQRLYLMRLNLLGPGPEPGRPPRGSDDGTRFPPRRPGSGPHGPTRRQPNGDDQPGDDLPPPAGLPAMQ